LIDVNGDTFFVKELAGVFFRLFSGSPLEVRPPNQFPRCNGATGKCGMASPMVMVDDVACAGLLIGNPLHIDTPRHKSFPPWLLWFLPAGLPTRILNLYASWPKWALSYVRLIIIAAIRVAL